MIAVLTWLLLLPVCSAQSADVTADADWHFRYELFQMLLEQSGVRPVSSVRDVLNDPARSVIVLLGRLDGVLPPRSIESFCDQGGAAILATDQTYSAGRICEFRNGPAEALQTADRYQNYTDCIRITDIDGDHPLMRGVSSLVVNRAGWLSKPRWFLRDWKVAARLPRQSRPPGAAGQPVLASLPLDSDRESAGRLLVASDPSLLTNGMLWHGDNAILAINAGRLLAEGDRDQMLFIVDGSILGSYRNSPLLNSDPSSMPPLPEDLPEPETQTMLRAANLFIRNAEESNLLNEAIANQPRHISEPSYRRALLFTVLILALLIVIWKLAATGPTPHPAMPVREMKSALALTSGQQIRATEFGLAASMLARELCRELTGLPDPAEWQRLLSGNAASGTAVALKKSHQNQLATVLNLAVNTRTVHISRRRFETIGRTIQQLRQLHREGRLLASSERPTQP
ncbi:MAG: hypothetical protein RIK87_10465 [Fuerstiella sp.]